MAATGSRFFDLSFHFGDMGQPVQWLKLRSPKGLNDGRQFGFIRRVNVEAFSIGFDVAVYRREKRPSKLLEKGVR